MLIIATQNLCESKFLWLTEILTIKNGKSDQVEEMADFFFVLGVNKIILIKWKWINISYYDMKIDFYD